MECELVTRPDTCRSDRSAPMSPADREPATAASDVCSARANRDELAEATGQTTLSQRQLSATMSSPERKRYGATAAERAALRAPMEGRRGNE